MSKDRFQPQYIGLDMGNVSLTNTTPLTEGLALKELQPQVADSLGAAKGTQKKELAVTNIM